MKHIFLYGPPGSGKTTVGKALAANLELPFLDLDAEIEMIAGKTIPEIMTTQGEVAFRELESSTLKQVITRGACVIALGGGALLRDANRTCAESNGEVVVLTTDLLILTERLMTDKGRRPLLEGDMEEKLNTLLERRKAHYNSFDLRIANDSNAPDEAAWEIQQKLGKFRVQKASGDYDVIIKKNSLSLVGKMLKERKLSNSMVVVTDSNVGPLYADVLQSSLLDAGINTNTIILPAGEQNKTLETVSGLWYDFIQMGLDRKSIVIALGGGVTGDLAGFAASTFMRGIAWVGIPTSLLAMVDSSMGGKTGFDLPYGKNLVGSFHSPKLVLADPDLLSTLPQSEFRSGLGEVVKHGIIADGKLFELCSNGEDSIRTNLDEIVRRAMAVKIHFIEADPFDKGIRAALNYGHTVGHAVELASGFHLRHGEAVAIGMVVEARLAEQLSIAANGLSRQIAFALAGIGLPNKIPSDLSKEAILQAMKVDKKKQAGKILFSLPLRIGEVKTSIEIDDLNMVFMED